MGGVCILTQAVTFCSLASIDLWANHNGNAFGPTSKVSLITLSTPFESPNIRCLLRLKAIS